jgi:hypothetical protein
MDIDDAIKITETLSKYKSAWVDVMMVEELGLSSEDENPIKNGLVTFLAFVLFGIVPCRLFIIFYYF